MPTDIILYDIRTALSVPTSPNTWKVRLVLNYKKLQYRTEWCSTTAIEATCKPLGIPPTGIKPDGTPHFTLPAIIDRTDPSHPIYLSDSLPIIEYLENTYPSAPGRELFPAHTKAFQSIFNNFVMPALFLSLQELGISALYNAKLPGDKTDFEARILARTGKHWKSLEKQGAEREAAFSKLKGTLTMLKTACDKSGEGEYLTDGQVSFADLALCAWFITIKTTSKNDIWARIVTWDDGKWARYVHSFQEWMTVI
ncbi:Glutathione S-transferase-like protein ustS [Psilocybe cubensis]|uniref:Glutathione S-transferase-like protein ustS n=2 Tax=Psilocybe cubensis TaxID=181762 RepID=A0ACB8GJN7_PSICU|nr:Glutathione S-transferase-like protein ustS [Psilocybe cubensis]KAH9475896.1 Glutathione S-transferase-like protein ustS [Psilocybe cubensis]